MPAADAFKIKTAQDVGAQGALVSLHSGVVNVTSTANANANEISGGGYARLTTTWGTPVIGASSPDVGKAVMTGSTIQFNVETGDTASHFCVRKTDGTPLWADALIPGVTINAAGNGKVDVIPQYKYTHT